MADQKLGFAKYYISEQITQDTNLLQRELETVIKIPDFF